MIRYNLFLTESQLSTLKRYSEKGISVSEHIRIAISRYIEEREKSNLNVSKSPSGQLPIKEVK